MYRSCVQRLQRGICGNSGERKDHFGNNDSIYRNDNREVNRVMAEMKKFVIAIGEDGSCEATPYKGDYDEGFEDGVQAVRSMGPYNVGYHDGYQAGLSEAAQKPHISVERALEVLMNYQIMSEKDTIKDDYEAFTMAIEALGGRNNAEVPE